MTFCTVINCMDGRIQLPIIEYLCGRFNIEYVDSITEPGPNLILAKQDPKVLVDSIMERLRISIENHNSVGIAIVGHHECAGNPAGKDEQVAHIRSAIEVVRQRYPTMDIIGLWVDKNWKVNELIIK
ncbi:MAG: hypothetical protein K9N52_07715 [Verrucomicrobia bacterium]|nr:hypothetical protein [Verrucomicrobiota bacterium]